MSDTARREKEPSPPRPSSEPACGSRFWVTCYTDASFSRDGAGWGVWLRCIEGRLVRSGPCPAYVRDSNEAELAAIFAGLYLARKTWGRALRGLLIYTDSQTAIAYLNHALIAARAERRSPAVARLRQRILAFSADHEIELDLRWVQGHQKTNTVRAYLNNHCDKLAGRARGVARGTRSIAGEPAPGSAAKPTRAAEPASPADGAAEHGTATPGPRRKSKKQKARERRARARERKRKRPA